MSSRHLTDKIKAEAQNLGFLACGVAKAEPVGEAEARRFRHWIEHAGHASMAYMEANADKRLDPRLLMEGVKSIVCVAISYAPARNMPPDELQMAAYALGQDYHVVVKDKLHALASSAGTEHYRAFCDTAPVLERYWAVQAGLGWVGRNHQLIVPGAGSMFFLGELFLDIELEYDSPLPSRCGHCRACLDACPTGALGVSGQGGEDSVFDSALCLSYQTIENRGEIPPSVASKMGNCIYGCDRCQAACPWNRLAKPTAEPLFQPREELIGMTKERWAMLSVDEYRRLFKGSAVKRVKYEGLMRNIKLVLNGQDGMSDDERS